MSFKRQEREVTLLLPEIEKDQTFQSTDVMAHGQDYE